MNNGQNVARSRHLEELARAAKQYTLQEILDVTEAVATELENLNDFTGATSIAGGLSGLVPAPQAGDESKFLRGDGSWSTVESGGASIAVFTGATTNHGTSGLVPAPQAGDNGKFLRGDGTWATVESGSSGGIDYVIGSKVSSVEGGFWQDIINDTPVLKLRHGDYEYNFQYDDLTFLGGASSPLVTVTPDTYVLGTASVSSEGGVWYEVNNNVPTLKLHAGNYNYGFKYDSITYKGGNSHLVAYLPFDASTTADACGNTWEPYNNSSTPVVNLDFDIKKFGQASLKPLSKSGIRTNLFFNPNADKWTVDAWFYNNSLDAFTFGFGNTINNENTGFLLNYIGLSINGAQKSTALNRDAFPANEWAHVAVVKNGSNFLLFKNGQLVGTFECTESFPTDSHVTLGLACGYNSGECRYDSFRVFEGVALWTSNFTPPTANDYL